LITFFAFRAFVDQASECCDYGGDGEHYQKDG
jgi:hypothetical protein